MKLTTLVIIGAAIGAAAGRAIGAPFPGAGANPHLDLIAYHGPASTPLAHLRYYAAPSARDSMLRRPVVSAKRSGSLRARVERERPANRTGAGDGRWLSRPGSHLRGAPLDGLPARIAGPERPAAEDGMECTSQPPQMPRQASKMGGRYGHGLLFQRGTAAPEAVAQPQSGQRHMQSPICTSEPRSRAHEVCFTCAVPARPQARVRSPINHQPQLSCAPHPHRPLTTRLNRFRRGVEYPLDGPALAGKPRSREIANAQIVQSIIQKGIE